MEGDNTEDEVVEVRLPRSQYKVLRHMIEREEAFGFFKKWIYTNWIYIVGTLMLSGIYFYDQIHNFIIGKP